MSHKKINVVFSIPTYDSFDTYIPVTRITYAQLEQLQQSISCATLPKDSCLTSMSIKFIDSMSFLAGGSRRNRITERDLTLEISDLFYLADTNHRLLCSNCKKKGEHAMIRHCANILPNGGCRDEFMRRTLGAALFPKLYAKENQK